MLDFLLKSPCQLQSMLNTRQDSPHYSCQHGKDPRYCAKQLFSTIRLPTFLLSPKLLWTSPYASSSKILFPISYSDPFQPFICFTYQQASSSFSLSTLMHPLQQSFAEFPTGQVLCFMIQRTHWHPTEPQQSWQYNVHPKRGATESQFSIQLSWCYTAYVFQAKFTLGSIWLILLGRFNSSKNEWQAQC